MALARGHGGLRTAFCPEARAGESRRRQPLANLPWGPGRVVSPGGSNSAQSLGAVRTSEGRRSTLEEQGRPEGADPDMEPASGGFWAGAVDVHRRHKSGRVLPVQPHSSLSANEQP